MSSSLSRRAFTMIELVFIIVILGILGAIAVPKMAASREDATVVAYMQDIRSAMQAIPAYYMSQGKIDSYADVLSLDPSRWVAKNDKLIFTLMDRKGKSLSAEVAKSDGGGGICASIEEVDATTFKIRAFAGEASGACLRIANELLKQGGTGDYEPTIKLDYGAKAVQF